MVLLCRSLVKMFYATGLETAGKQASKEITHKNIQQNYIKTVCKNWPKNRQTSFFLLSPAVAVFCLRRLHILTLDQCQGYKQMDLLQIVKMIPLVHIQRMRHSQDSFSRICIRTILHQLNPFQVKKYLDVQWIFWRVYDSIGRMMLLLDSTSRGTLIVQEYTGRLLMEWDFYCRFLLTRIVAF